MSVRSPLTAVFVMGAVPRGMQRVTVYLRAVHFTCAQSSQCQATRLALVKVTVISLKTKSACEGCDLELSAACSL